VVSLSQPKIKAYAILSGGGVKGAALAGALKAAEELDIEFVGYGGSSAGSIIALLASLGYSNEEIREIVLCRNFVDFLDDSGQLLEKFKTILGEATSLPRLLKAAIKAWQYGIWHQMYHHLGLYHGKGLSGFIEERILEKIPALEGLSSVTFSHLTDRGCKPLKVVASDIQGRRPIIYSSWEVNDQVSHAIRASAGFPFVFQPVKLKGKRMLVDGGLSSNLPVALFNEERSWAGVPILAFDLQSSSANPESGYGIRSYSSDLLATALEAGDTFYRMSSNVHYIPIKIPAGIDTLSFFVTRQDRERLWDAGLEQAYRTLDLTFRNNRGSANSIQSYHAALNLPPSYLESLLLSLSAEVGHLTSAKDIRAYIFLLDERRQLLLMRHLDDSHPPVPEVSLDAGSSWPMCRAFRDKQPQAADLAEWTAKQAPHILGQFPEVVGRRASFSVPIFEIGEKAALARNVREIPAIGALVIDSVTPLDKTGWIVQNGDARVIHEVVSRWAGILARVLH
jgi:NTE family protein